MKSRIQCDRINCGEWALRYRCWTPHYELCELYSQQGNIERKPEQKGFPSITITQSPADTFNQRLDVPEKHTLDDFSGGSNE